MNIKMKVLWTTLTSLLVSLSAASVHAAVLAEWEFLDQASLTTDSSGNGNTLTGGTGVTVSTENYNPAGGTTTSAYFNGSQGWLRANDMVVSSYEALQFEWSMQATGSASSTDSQRILQSNYDHNAIGGFAIYLRRDSGEIRISHRVEGGWGQAYFSVSTLDVWHEYKVVINNADSTAEGHITLWVDGVEQTAISSTYSGTGSGTFLDTQLYLGSNASSAGVSATAKNLLNGYLQNVRVTAIPEVSSLAWGLILIPAVVALRRGRVLRD
ncbi:MAG: hypothetical protein Q7Q73_15785 [Verrucomicrobiota bacterium JB024]|nr:hypothetical protein [Verrucomicrobiota bacterium JB024]